MAEIILTPGDLPPPACYPTEQDRFVAYVAAIIASISGGIEWTSDTIAPADLTQYWSRLIGTRPQEPLQWSTDDGEWVRWASEVISTGASGGIADAYTLTNTPAMTGPGITRPGQLWVMFAAAANTGPATLNVDGVGPLPIRLADGVTALVAGNIVVNQGMLLMTGALGTHFILLNPTAIAAVPNLATITGEIATLPGVGTGTTVTHGFATVPDVIQGMMVCTIAEAGYSVNDVVQLGCIKLDSNGAGDAAGDAAEVFSYAYGATDLILTQNAASNGQGPYISGKSDGVMTAFTAANWKFRFTAVIYNT